jgi:hypothetical protein
MSKSIHRGQDRRSRAAVPLLASFLLAASAAGCGAEPEGLAALSGPVVAIYPRGSDGEAETPGLTAAAVSSQGRASGREFYLAINRRELGQHWFLSAYLSQLAPDGVVSGAARSLGTWVVSFKLQNGKLFVFDVGEGKAWSDAFRPDVVLEAYPVVTGIPSFENLPGASEYVLFDPAAGLNRFHLFQDGWQPVDIALSFSQRFRKLSDGVTFDQVFSGSATGGARAITRLTGTLSLSLRRYQEGPGYAPTAMPAKELYFRSPSRQVPDEGRSKFVAARWNIQAGGPPIVWKIARTAEALGQRPEWSDIDFVGAVKAGIESWNEAFGWKAIEARVADAGEAPGDDDVNYFIFDTTRSYNTAFANWRSNPNTGEIRGASVYFPLALLKSTMDLPPAPAALVAGYAPFEARPAAREPRLAWGLASEESLCDVEMPSLPEMAAIPDPPGAVPLTRKERIERFLGSRAAHELGHTLGLRHNFKGSLQPPSSSVMEYMTTSDTVATGPHVGSYDRAAVRYLYGLSPDLPTEPFCSDPEADVVDPDCRRGDKGSKPLSDSFIPSYRTSLAAFLAGTSDGVQPAASLAAHLRLGAAPEVRMEAYEGALAPLRAPIVAPPGAPPSFNSRVNFATQLAIQQLFLDPLPSGAPAGAVTPPPVAPPGEPVLAVATADLAALITNQDRIRSPAIRRLAVDVLKRFQSVGASSALARARDQLAAELPGLADAAAVQTKDLIERIDRALEPYFN